jgi:hypothetical protein
VCVGDHLQSWRGRLYIPLVARPIVEVGGAGFEDARAAVVGPARGRNPVGRFVSGIDTSSAGPGGAGWALKRPQSLVGGVVFGGAVGEKVVAVGRAALAREDDGVVGVGVAIVAAGDKDRLGGGDYLGGGHGCLPPHKRRQRGGHQRSPYDQHECQAVPPGPLTACFHLSFSHSWTTVLLLRETSSASVHGHTSYVRAPFPPLTEL